MDSIKVIIPEDPEERRNRHEMAKLAKDMQPKLYVPWHKRKRTWVIASVVTLVLAGGVALAWMTWPKAPLASADPTPTPSTTPTPTPLRKASPLTGVMLEPALADRPVVSVIVENHPAARPQSGLSDAGVVYEALAEGGITRFQTFFLEGRPNSLGPVRSLRPYFNDWALEYNAPVAHAGGSATALGQVNSLGVKSLNALGIGAPTFFRTKDRAAPHNLYTNSGLLDNLLRGRGYFKAATFTPSPRKADAPKTGAAHRTIAINYSSASYQVTYTYDPATNSYKRNLAGQPHIDRNSGTQIKVKNVVVLYTPTSTADAAGHLAMTTTGRGSGVLFRDGEAIPCTWVKDNRTARTKLLDANGVELALNAGNTWYSVVPVGRAVTY